MYRRPAQLFAALLGAGLGVAWPGAAVAAEDAFTIFPDPLWLLVLILIFLALVVPLDRLLFRPMMKALDERRVRIEGARERAEVVADQADEVLGRYQRAVEAARREAEASRREVLDRARREQTQVMTQAREEAEAQRAQARGQVADALEAARGQLRDESHELAREIASRLLGRSVA